MKLAVLFSGGKDSTLAAWMAKQEGHELACLVSMISRNESSYMFHTPSISQTKVQASAMGVPLIEQETGGEKEIELEDLIAALRRAKQEYGVEGIVTGAVASVYQASRVQRVCFELGLTCFNPLWQKDQIELLEELLAAGFVAIVVGVFAYPLDQQFLGRVIDKDLILEMKRLREQYQINPAGEGGEFESFVLEGPLFARPVKQVGFKDKGESHSWRREVEVA